MKTTILAMAFISLTTMSCTDSKNQDATQTMHPEMNQDDMHHDEMSASNTMMDTNAQNPEAKKVLADYMVLKDALVETDEKAASNAGKKLENTLKGFNVETYSSEQQKELKDIIESSMEHAEHIAKSDIEHQREHFEMLSSDMMDMVAITGTENTLYQQFCPMYGDGGAWLSMEENIRNPYFGSKMMKCGELQKTIK